MLITKSIRSSLILLFLAFALLVSISVIATFWGIKVQSNDARIINLAGRQRMLVELITRLAIEPRDQASSGDSQELITAMNTFYTTLSALQDGGWTSYLDGEQVELPAATNPQILAELSRVQASWDLYQAAVEQVTRPENREELSLAAFQTITELTPQLVEQADRVVRLFEIEASQKITQLRNFQIIFLCSALVFSGLGFFLIYKSILQPLDLLVSRAKLIGDGKLETPAQIANPREFALLDKVVDEMQTQIRISQQALVTWAETLEERVAQRTSMLDALNEISKDISSRLDVRHVLESVTEKACSLLGGEVAALCILENQGEYLVLKARSGSPKAVIYTHSPAQSAPAQDVLSHKQARSCQVGECKADCRILAESYRASHLIAPLFIESRVIGVLCVGSSQVNAFSEEALPCLEKLASSAAIALQNARLYAQAEKIAALEERQRIAAEMHDCLGQTISRIGMQIDLADKLLEQPQHGQAHQELEKARELVSDASDEVRSTIAHLMDEQTIRRSLQEQLESLVKDLSEKAASGIGLEWHCNLPEPLMLPRQQEEQVLRVAGEAINNACHHARAGQVQVCLERTGPVFSLVIEDDGQGFDPAKIPGDSAQHFGLKIMRARAIHLGGELRVDSAPGQGTRLTLLWPESQHTERTTP